MRALNVALRKALIEAHAISSRLGTFRNAPSVHTRRPVPKGATYPMIAISPNITRGNADALISHRPIITRDIIVYGENKPSTGVDQIDEYREVEDIADLVRALFHRKKHSIVVDGHHVIEIIADGPIGAPTEDENKVARAIMLTIRLQEE